MTFRRLTFFDQLLELLFPRRRRGEARLKAAIRWLVEHPEVPVSYDD